MPAIPLEIKGIFDSGISSPHWLDQGIGGQCREQEKEDERIKERLRKGGGWRCAHRAALFLFLPFMSLKVNWEREAKNKALSLTLAY